MTKTYNIYKTNWEGLSKLFDEYIDLHYKGAPILDTGSNYDVYCKVLTDLINEEKQKSSLFQKILMNNTFSL